MVKHTEHCLKMTAERQAAIEAWEAEHPDYCRACGGRGWFEDLGTYWDPPERWECEQCIDSNGCPRCGSYLFDALDDPRCADCDWRLSDYPEGAPDPYECFCWDQEDIEANDALARHAAAEYHAGHTRTITRGTE